MAEVERLFDRLDSQFKTARHRLRQRCYSGPNPCKEGLMSHSMPRRSDSLGQAF